MIDLIKYELSHCKQYLIGGDHIREWETKKTYKIRSKYTKWEVINELSWATNKPEINPFWTQYYRYYSKKNQFDQRINILSPWFTDG